jgi:hypothetical protein
MQEADTGGRIQVVSWQQLPCRAAACAGLLAFATSIVVGLAAGNDAGIILLRSILAMSACWAVAWMAGILVVRAVHGDARTDCEGEEAELEHSEITVDSAGLNPVETPVA